MNEASGPRAGAGGKVVLLHKRNAEATQRQVTRNTGANDAAAHDQDIQRLGLKRLQRLAAATSGRRRDRHDDYSLTGLVAETDTRSAGVYAAGTVLKAPPEANMAVRHGSKRPVSAARSTTV